MPELGLLEVLLKYKDYVDAKVVPKVEAPGAAGAVDKVEAHGVNSS